MIYPQDWRALNAAAKEFHGTEPQVLAHMLTDLMAERQAAADRGEPKPPFFQLRAIDQALAQQFGTEHGWTLSPSDFSLCMLAEGSPQPRRSIEDTDVDASRFDDLDHPYFYRRFRRPAAIAAHLYDLSDYRRARCEALAERFDLDLLVPDFPSWWNPQKNGTTLVVYVGPAGRSGYRPPKCKTCDYPYLPKTVKNNRKHLVLHRAALEARKALAGTGPGPLPLTYGAREALKAPQRDVDALAYAENSMWSRFARSLSAANYALDTHPTWQRYARAYVAQPHIRETWGDAITDRLVTKFGAEPSPFLPNGYSYWHHYTPTEARRYSERGEGDR